MTSAEAARLEEGEEKMANLVEATSRQQFEEFLSKAGKNLTVVHFQADWAPQCGQMNEVMAELAKQQPHSTFIKLEAETVAELSQRYLSL